MHRVASGFLLDNKWLQALDDSDELSHEIRGGIIRFSQPSAEEIRDDSMIKSKDTLS
jgi:hypothetical protein